MTQVRLSWLRPDLETMRAPAEGAVTFIPTARHLHDLSIVVDVPQHMDLDGDHTVTLAPTGPDWCWEVRFQPRRATPWTVHVTVPDVTGVVDFVDLPRVDPNTLEPVEVDEPLWWAALAALEREPGPPGKDSEHVRTDTTVGTRVFVDNIMIYGDTGWFDVSGHLSEGVLLSHNAGRARMKRTNDKIFAQLIIDLNEQHQNSAQVNVLENLPNPFRIQNTYQNGGIDSEGDIFGFLRTVSTVSLRRAPGQGNINKSRVNIELQWFAQGSWPTKLPETPEGDAQQ